MRIFVLLALFCISTATVAEMYKWTDQDGEIIYSDKPNPNGSEEKVEGAPLTTYKPTTPQKKFTFTPDTADKNSTRGRVSYSTFSIDQPVNDAAVRENTGNVRLSMSITPELNSSRNHKIEIYLDGSKKAETSGLSYQFANMDRGTHTVTAKIVDGSGKVFKTASVTFHLQRHSSR